MAVIVDKDKLLEGLTLTAEQKTALESVLGDEKNLETFSRRYLRRDEGSRLAQEAAAAKATADEATAKAQKSFEDGEAYKTTLTEWETKQKADLAAERQAMQAEQLKFKQALIAQGIDPTSELGLAMTKENDTPPAFDPKSLDGKYLSMELGRALAQQAIEIPLKMPAIMARYQKLYGNLDADWGGLQEAAKSNLLTKNIPIEQTAEEFLKFATREQELKAEADEARINKEVEERFNQRMSSVKLPGGAYVPDTATDKIFTSEFAEQHKDSDTVQDKRALDHFLQVNEELAKSGVRMEY